LAKSVSRSLPQPSLVAMAMKFVKFGQNWLELGLHIAFICWIPKSLC